MALLDAAAKANPDASWWIKGDGCDVVPGLDESMRLVWSGDVDFDTGDLQRAYEVYRSKLEFISSIGLKSRREKGIIKNDLVEIHRQLQSDKEFVIKGIAVAWQAMFLYCMCYIMCALFRACCC